jgi:Protein of unknown function (DUF1826)
MRSAPPPAAQDVCAALRERCGVRTAAVKLQCVHGTACPRVHVDHVRVRALCTYLGPGTVFLPSEAAVVRGDEVVAYAAASAVATGAGDVLYLKGVEEGGGPAAAHRSPEWQGARLVLTIDTAVDAIEYFLAG